LRLADLVKWRRRSEVALSDGTVALRPWRDGDAQDLFAAAQDPDIAWRIPIPSPFTIDDARRFIRYSQQAERHNDVASFAIVDAANGRLLGSISRYRPTPQVASFGYWLAADARGQGAATRALRLVSDWTLAGTDVELLEVEVVVGNETSVRVAERAGFVRTEILKDNYVERGVTRDCVLLERWRPLPR
jgi:RimJ/RimL family protein N-acetyltransferase